MGCVPVLGEMTSLSRAVTHAAHMAGALTPLTRTMIIPVDTAVFAAAVAVLACYVVVIVCNVVEYFMKTAAARHFIFVLVLALLQAAHRHALQGINKSSHGLI